MILMWQIVSFLVYADLFPLVGSYIWLNPGALIENKIVWFLYGTFLLVNIWRVTDGSSCCYYRQVSNIRRTKSQNLNDSRTVLRLSLPNPLKPDVKSRMKM